MSNDALQKAVFTTQCTLWQWDGFPFGLTSAPATFKRLIDKFPQGLQQKTLRLYLDDVIVFSSSLENYFERLKLVLQRFPEANSKFKASKCELLLQ